MIPSQSYCFLVLFQRPLFLLLLILQTCIIHSFAFTPCKRFVRSFPTASRLHYLRRSPCLPRTIPTRRADDSYHSSTTTRSFRNRTLQSSSSSSSLFIKNNMSNDNTSNISPPRISISDAFDGGNGIYQGIEYDATQNQWTVLVHIRPDPCVFLFFIHMFSIPFLFFTRFSFSFTLYEQKHHSQYFSFRSTLSLPSLLQQDSITIRYVVANAGQASYVHKYFFPFDF